MSGYDMERLAELIGMLPPAPVGWVEAAQELPRARRELDEIVQRAEADDEFRQRQEDDALRAGRAAAEARDGIATLNEELERDRGVRIQVRMGVNTGEVVAGDPTTGQNLVTGDAVNIAARLEQAAAPGEILIG